MLTVYRKIRVACWRKSFSGSLLTLRVPTMSDVGAIAQTLTEVLLAANNSLDRGNRNSDDAPVIIGATVPTGFENTAAAEVKEKLGCQCKISKDRGKIYFEIKKESLAQVHHLRSVDNLFVIVQEFSDFPFKEPKEAALKDFQDLAAKLTWERALSAWELNNSLKKRKRRRKPGACVKEKKQPEALPEAETPAEDCDEGSKPLGLSDKEETETNMNQDPPVVSADADGEASSEDCAGKVPKSANGSILPNEAMGTQDSGNDAGREAEDKEDEAVSDTSSIMKFRVTCNRVGDKHSFTSNEAAREFGGAVQELFQWKADMTNFDVEVLLNISYNEMLVGIALTEESLHRRNITHFGPTTLRSTLAYGMLRLCDLQPSDIIIDPMCGTGAIPIEGVSEWSDCFFIGGDNNLQAVKRTTSNIQSLLKKHQRHESAPQGLPIDAVHWDISSLPLKSGSVDVIVTDMPFGKRIGSKKKNWNLYPACLREMSRVCRAGTGRAVLLTHDKKCFIKALAKAGHLWKKVHTVWVNIGGLHAGVYLLKRTNYDSTRETKEETQPRDPLSSPNE